MRPRPEILCIGAVLWDMLGACRAPMPRGGDETGSILRRPGGVALNVAAALRRLGPTPAPVGVVGSDAEGDALIAATGDIGLATDFILRADARPTDRYMAIEDSDGLVAAVADVETLDASGQQILAPLADGRLGSAAEPFAGTIMLDGNLRFLATIADNPLFAGADLRVASASPGQTSNLAPLLDHPRATFYLNRAEAERLCGAEFADARAAAQGVIERGAGRVLVTDGRADAAEAQIGAPAFEVTPPQRPTGRHPAPRVTGAGDSFLAAHIAAEHNGAAPDEAMRKALAAAARHLWKQRP